MGTLAFIALAVAALGLILSKRRLAGQADGPVLLSLQCPLIVSEVTLHSDGCVGVELGGVKGGAFDFSLDRRSGSSTWHRLFIGAQHPSADAADLLPEGCAYEREIVHVLEAALSGESPGIVAAPEGARVSGATYECHHCGNSIWVPEVWERDVLVCPTCGVQHEREQVVAGSKAVSPDSDWPSAMNHLRAVLDVLRPDPTGGEAPKWR